jgi:hypothetical protein
MIIILRTTTMSAAQGRTSFIAPVRVPATAPETASSGASSVCQETAALNQALGNSKPDFCRVSPRPL